MPAIIVAAIAAFALLGTIVASPDSDALGDFKLIIVGLFAFVALFAIIGAAWMGRP